MEKIHPLIGKEIQECFIIGDISKQILDEQYNIIEKIIGMTWFPNMKCVEIGSWTGLSAVIIGTVIKRVFGKLYSIDWYKGSKSGPTHLHINSQEARIRFFENIKKFDLEDTIEQLRMTSQEASKFFDNETLDFIFIDGDHSYNSVKSDIELWYPKLKYNSIISGHDYDSETGVIEAVNEKFNNKFDSEKGIWWIRK